MTSNLIAIINQLAILKQLDKQKLADIIEESLYSSIAKKLTVENDLDIVVDFENNKVEATFYRFVVEHDRGLGQISINEANANNQEYEIGDKILIKMSISEFEPKVIKNAKRAIQEKIKKMEEDRIMFDYENQKNKIVSGKIRKVDYNGYLIDLGYADALLPIDEQIDDEYYKPGDIIRSYVIDIRKRKKDVTIIVSRTHPEFIKRLFESEVPEVFSKDVEIKKIVRNPGLQTKVAIYTSNPKIDALGACLGERGLRIEQIRNELHGEHIDIVLWDEATEILIANAVGNDLVEKVFLSERGKFARIIVNATNKKSAIGQSGKNVKLAAKLTDYKLDIFTEEEFDEKIAEERRITSHISELDGVSEKMGQSLKEHGYTSVQDIHIASLEELCSLDGIGKKGAEKIKHSAEYF
ncbi:MAG: transcription termination factor NusA [Candidatus Cloacimonadota bacterium]|nr:transcription termination factor NusA [Candidatus Cloacimonadota bacterium]